jgi:Fe-S oxidoreductase
MLYQLRGHEQPVPFVEDVGVPVEHLADYLRRVQEILQKAQTTGSFLVHAGAGQVHTRPFLDLRQPENVQRLRDLAEEIYRVALDLGGTISTQHGVGLARTPWVAQQYGRLAQVFRDIKHLFDPQNLFNPGKIIDGAGTALTENLRREAPPEPSPAPWRLRWPVGEIAAQCHSCNGCGGCRTEAPTQRMCPLFRVHETEAATPRAKVNLLRSLLSAESKLLNPEQPALSIQHSALSTDAVRQVADLCINCKMCALECPAHVQVPKLMLEAKAQHAAAHGLSGSDWVMARTENFAAVGSGLAWLLNSCLDNPMIRWWLQRVFGVSRRRKLPLFAQRSFLSTAARHGWTTRPQRLSAAKVAYFVDVFANYNDPTIAEATVAVLHHHGIDVYVPPDQIGCGMAPLAYGDVDTARRMARHNLRILVELARAGYEIICSEPTAALMLRQDYLDLIGDLDARTVADKTIELTGFLARLQDAGKLRTDFQQLPCSIGHHVPCHVKALGQGVPGPQLLTLIPGLKVRTIDVSCSGMAGTYGLKEENFEMSLAAGKPMLDQLRRDDLLFGSSECSACRLQMEQGSNKRSLHPVQYLALAYGLMPRLADRLREPIGKLVLR